MHTLVTLNLNNLTTTEEKKREDFYKALEAEKWVKVKGTDLDTTWTIFWNAPRTRESADTIIKQDLETAATKSGIPKARVKAMWAHDPEKVRSYP